MKTYPLLASVESKPAKTIRFTAETVVLWEELKRLHIYDIPETARLAVHEALMELKRQHENTMAEKAG